MNSILLVLALFLSLLILGKPIQKQFLLGLAALFFLFNILVMSGKAKLVSLCLTYILSVLLSTIVFTIPNIPGFVELYMIGFMNLFVMGLTSLIGFYSWQSLPIAGINIAAVLADYFFRISAVDLAGGRGLQYDDAFIVIVLTLFTSINLVLVHKRSGAFLKSTKELNAKADEQLGILHSAMTASGSALAMGNQLTASAAKSAELSARAESLASEAASSMQLILGDSSKLSEDISGIAINSGTVKSSTEAQSSVVNQTSAAIEEMTASIHSITNITRERRNSVIALSKSTEEGQKVVSSSSEAMKKVEESTGSILEIIKVISAVAAQTNLLAMNAAIEAAHAGNFGRGFAVVADEIRKLSEETGKNVKAVTTTVKATIGDIRNAAESNDKAVYSFGGIAKEAVLVSSAMEEIINGLDELSKGTDEINRGVADSVSSTNNLRTAVASLDEQISGAENRIASLKSFTVKAAAELVKVKEELVLIKEESKNVEEIGELNSEGLASLKSALNKLN